MRTMTRKFNAVVTRDDEWFVAQCLEVDVASQGENEEQALQNLNEALRLHFSDPQATVLPIVRNIELELAA